MLEVLVSSLQNAAATPKQRSPSSLSLLGNALSPNASLRETASVNSDSSPTTSRGAGTRESVSLTVEMERSYGDSGEAVGNDGKPITLKPTSKRALGGSASLIPSDTDRGCVTKEGSERETNDIIFKSSARRNRFKKSVGFKYKHP